MRRFFFKLILQIKDCLIKLQNILRKYFDSMTSKSNKDTYKFGQKRKESPKKLNIAYCIFEVYVYLANVCSKLYNVQTIFAKPHGPQCKVTILLCHSLHFENSRNGLVSISHFESLESLLQCPISLNDYHRGICIFMKWKKRALIPIAVGQTVKLQAFAQPNQLQHYNFSRQLLFFFLP